MAGTVARGGPGLQAPSQDLTSGTHLLADPSQLDLQTGQRAVAVVVSPVAQLGGTLLGGGDDRVRTVIGLATTFSEETRRSASSWAWRIRRSDSFRP